MNRKAYTLLEVLVSMIVFAGLFLPMFAILNSGNQIFFVVTNSIELRQQARNAMDRIVREVRESNQSTVTVDALDPNSSTLSFYGPRYKDAGGAFQPIKYSLVSGRIMREFPPGDIKPIAVKVTRLYFNKVGPQLEILIKVENPLADRPLELTLTQKVRMRNE
jgi:type II secretory pathway pseudopilin PulG